MTRLLTTGLVALLVLVAGCGGGVPGGGGGSDDGDGGTVNFYISDQQNAIDEFEHLNVTVTTVGLHRKGHGDATAANGSDGGNDTESGEWLTYEVGSVTYDLTKLQGANASRVGELPVPNGTYTQVYVQVTDIEGTLKSGEEVDVKLPSNRLRVNSQFTVGNGETVDFVFDVTVFETGNGRYILKPVASESGAGKEVRENPDATRGGQGQGGERAQGGEGDSQGQGQVDFYVSDEKNAIGDFAHLNVTITKVGLHKAGDGGGEESEEGEETGTEPERENETDTETESESDGGNGERAGWVEQEVDSATLDLTELQGANASQISELDAPAGTYDKVFVYVSEIDGTLQSGEQVNVKLPSNKLQITREFTVNADETVEFVYDISVFKAGNSGKYILKPVVSESGTSEEVEIRKRGGEREAEREEAERLNATFTTDVVAGETATIEVTQNGSAVANATVAVNGETVGRTDADGRRTFTVPSDAEAVEVEVTKGDMEGELSRELSGGETTTADGSGSGEQSTAAA